MMAGRRDDPSLSRHASAPSRARSLRLQAFQFCKHSTYLPTTARASFPPSPAPPIQTDSRLTGAHSHTLRSVVHFSARFELKASAACDYGNRSPFMSCATGLRPSATHPRSGILFSPTLRPQGARLPRIETQVGFRGAISNQPQPRIT